MIRKRRVQGTTNYRKRIALLKGGLLRIVVRKSNRGITMQVCEYSENGDKVLASANSKELKGMGWPSRGNTPTAYLTGMLLAHNASKVKDREMVLDIGLQKPTKASVLFAAAKGAIDSGLKVRSGIEFDEKRITGEHIINYAKSMKQGEGSEHQFSSYRKDNVDIERMNVLFNKVKDSIREGK